MAVASSLMERFVADPEPRRARCGGRGRRGRRRRPGTARPRTAQPRAAQHSRGRRGCTAPTYGDLCARRAHTVRRAGMRLTPARPTDHQAAEAQSGPPLGPSRPGRLGEIHRQHQPGPGPDRQRPQPLRERPVKTSIDSRTETSFQPTRRPNRRTPCDHSIHTPCCPATARPASPQTAGCRVALPGQVPAGMACGSVATAHRRSLTARAGGRTRQGRLCSRGRMMALSRNAISSNAPTTSRPACEVRARSAPQFSTWKEQRAEGARISPAKGLGRR